MPHPTNPVHPRVCGEHGNIAYIAAPAVGSSPRVRGTHPICQRAPPPRRFIPACAGNTCGASCTAVWISVHPRVCGEHIGSERVERCHCGSSPRVRGTRVDATALRLVGRFIPACAGNTSPKAHRYPTSTVHPRVCGEHICRPISPAARIGSSPRVRGTHRLGCVPQAVNRFIPACAGNTARPPS